MQGSNLGGSPDPRHTRHVSDLYPTLERLVAAGERAQSLVDSPGWGVLLKLLDAEVATIDRELDSGRVLESRAAYAAAHGRRGGLKAVPELVYALIGRAETRLMEERAKHEGAAESVPGGR